MMNGKKYFISILGGFQFGYTIAIMAGALLFLTPLFSLTTQQQGLMTSSILVGALAGVGFASLMADTLGRKKAQIVIALLFLVGTIVVISSHTLSTLAIGRIIQGIATGSISVIGPLYLAEVSPSGKRGQYISLYQMAVTFGILCAYVVSFIFSDSGNWKWMFAVGIVPTLLHGVGFLFLPDSHVHHEEKASWSSLLHPQYRPSLATAFIINILQQLSGINAVIYFAPTIMEQCGFHSASNAIFSAVLIGIINFLSTFLAVSLIDRKGRKPLLLLGSAGMALSLFVLAFTVEKELPIGPWISTASLMLYVASFAMSLGPVPQVLTSELFPHAVRGKAVSISLFLNWIFNFLVVFTFMDLTAYLKQSNTFFMYAIFCVITFYFIWKKVPETKGIALK